MATKLFVGSLSWNVTSDQLEEFFKSAGNVVSANVITDRDSGRSKGFGFVEMGSEEEAKKAIEELNGKELDGREISVNEARPREERPRSFGGGNGGGRDRGGFQGGRRY